MKTSNEIVGGIVASYRQKIAHHGPEEYINVDDGTSLEEDASATEDIIRETLRHKLASLKPDEQVRTCEDFGKVGIECCNICHSLHPHEDIGLVEIESGGQAWICCAMDRALNSERTRRFEDSAGFHEAEQQFWRPVQPRKTGEIEIV